ncbi:unnamed protein product [Arctogadus glacialis]
MTRPKLRPEGTKDLKGEHARLRGQRVQQCDRGALQRRAEFFRLWWETDATVTHQKQVRQLVKEGRLEFVLGGQVMMHDEAGVTDLDDQILQLTGNTKPTLLHYVDRLNHSADASPQSDLRWIQTALRTACRGTRDQQQEILTHVMDQFSYCAPSHLAFSNSPRLHQRGGGGSCSTGLWSWPSTSHDSLQRDKVGALTQHPNLDQQQEILTHVMDQFSYCAPSHLAFSNRWAGTDADRQTEGILVHIRVMLHRRLWNNLPWNRGSNLTLNDSSLNDSSRVQPVLWLALSSLASSPRLHQRGAVELQHRPLVVAVDQPPDGGPCGPPLEGFNVTIAPKEIRTFFFHFRTSSL